ncbi:MAG: diacylglycerol kinase family protein [Bacteroidia bacterium]
MQSTTLNVDKAVMPWRVILNPVSGKRKGVKRWPAIQQQLEKLAIPYERVVTDFPNHSKELVHEALQAGVRKFLLIGGDGTHFEVIDALYKQDITEPKDITIACLPAGTGNDWSRTIYPNADYNAILTAIKAEKTIAHDVGWATFQQADGSIGKHYFLNIAGLGFDAYVAANFLSNKKNLGAWDYLSGLLRGLISYAPGNARIHINGQTIEGKAFIVAAGICKYFGGGMKITPEAEPSDGLFDLTIVQNISKLKLVTALPKIYKGTFLSMPEVTHIRSKTIDIEANEPLYLQIDGELMGHTPVQMGIVPGGIQVVII